GLLPGGGGTQRLPRLIGAANALPLLLQGTSLDPQKALKAGIIHEVVAPDALIQRAKEWAKQGDPVQPWDKKDYQIPGGGPYAPGNDTFQIAVALVHKQTHGNYPAQDYILSCV